MAMRKPDGLARQLQRGNMTIRKIRRSRARKIQKLAAAGGLAATAGLIGTISEGAYGGTNQNLTPHLATAVAQPANLNAIVASQIALDIPDTVAAAQTAYGSSYAGAWIDNSSGRAHRTFE